MSDKPGQKVDVGGDNGSRAVASVLRNLEAQRARARQQGTDGRRNGPERVKPKPEDRAKISDLPQPIQKVIRDRQEKEHITDYTVEKMVKVWKGLAGDKKIAPYVLDAINHWQPKDIMALLDQKMSIHRLETLLPDTKDFIPVMLRYIHIYDEGKEQFLAGWKKFEDLLGREPVEGRAEVRRRILSMSREELRSVFLKPIEHPVHQIAGLEQTDIWLLKMLQASPEDMRRVVYNEARLQQELPEETWDKLKEFPAAKRFEIYLNRIRPNGTSEVDATILARDFDKKEVERIIGVLAPRQPTERDIELILPADRASLMRWNQEVAARRPELEATYQRVMDDVMKDPNNHYRGTQGFLIKLGIHTDGYNAYERDMLLMVLTDLSDPNLDQTSPEGIKAIRGKVAILRRIVPPEHLVAVLKPITRGVERYDSEHHAHFATFDEIIRQQARIDPVANSLLGLDARYGIPIYDPKTSSIFEAQSGGGKSVLIIRALTGGGINDPHGDQQGPLRRLEIERWSAEAIRGERPTRPNPPAMDSMMIVDSKAGELRSSTAAKIADTHDIAFISFDNPEQGQRVNPLAYIPRVNASIEPLKQQLEDARKGSDSPQKQLRIADLEAKLAQATTDVVRQQENAANQFARLWIAALDPETLAGAQVGAQSDVRNHIFDLMQATVMHLRESKPHAPLSDLHNLTSTQETLFNAIRGGQSEKAKAILDRYPELSDASSPYVKTVMGLLHGSTRTFVGDSISALTSANEMDALDLVNRPTALYIQFDHNRYRSDDVVPAYRLITGMMTYSISEEKARRFQDHLFMGANLHIFLEEFGVLNRRGGEPLDDLVAKLAIARSPDGLFINILTQNKGKLDPDLVAQVQYTKATYLSAEACARYEKELGNHLVWVRQYSDATQAGSENRYARTTSAIGLNAEQERAINTNEMQRHVEGMVPMYLPLMTAQEISQTFSHGHVLVTQTGQAPIHVLVTDPTNGKNPLNLDIIREPLKQVTGMRSDTMRAPDRDVWGRKAGVYVPEKNGRVYSETTDTVSSEEGGTREAVDTNDIRALDAQIAVIRAQIAQIAQITQIDQTQAQNLARIKDELEQLLEKREEVRGQDRYVQQDDVDAVSDF